METSNLDTLHNVWLWISATCCHLLPEEASLITTGQGAMWWIASTCFRMLRRPCISGMISI
ncbi:rCG41615 [Rattus norvegicus]|uniref:RCG41615 n=1 Tax=Rattus norvegicus TaxID=10116 RepID=A6IHD9_RAT|nr:rCG41615 [Rattus norvegicus]